MADIKSPEERSRNMAKIRSRDTQPEEYFRKLLFRHGYRYRKNAKDVPGHPDAWLAGYNTAVFIHGCFWHRHSGCRYAYTPKSHEAFWTEKFRKNVERDRAVSETLMKNGIRQLVVWECTIKQLKKNEELEAKLMARIENFLHSGDNCLEC